MDIPGTKFGAQKQPQAPLSQCMRSYVTLLHQLYFLELKESLTGRHAKTFKYRFLTTFLTFST